MDKPRLWMTSKLWFCAMSKWRYGRCGIGYTWQQAYDEWVRLGKP
jgi:hypothetical protein